MTDNRFMGIFITPAHSRLPDQPLAELESRRNEMAHIPLHPNREHLWSECRKKGSVKTLQPKDSCYKFGQQVHVNLRIDVEQASGADSIQLFSLPAKIQKVTFDSSTQEFQYVVFIEPDVLRRDFFVSKGKDQDGKVPKLMGYPEGMTLSISEKDIQSSQQIALRMYRF